MEVDKERLEEFETRMKVPMFEEIQEICDAQTESIQLMKATAKSLGLKEFEVDNSSIILNNKIVELSHVFKRAGVSMFSRIEKNSGSISPSFLGDTIIKDLIDKLVESIHKIEKCNKELEDMVNRKNELLQMIEEESSEKFSTRIKNAFSQNKSTKLSNMNPTPEEIESFNNSLQEYKNISSEIFNYNLEDNLIPSILKEMSKKIQDEGYSHPVYPAADVPKIIKEKVEPELRIMHLEHLIPKLQESIIEEYKKDLIPGLPIPEDKMHYHIPDFNRKEESYPERLLTKEELQKISDWEKRYVEEKKKNEETNKVNEDNERLSDLSMMMEDLESNKYTLPDKGRQY